ncbi:hypothetical protein GPALN_004052 [Globodera pallida]|nr:hypothetical protein GPALN_004052 [Globodera pallida]
MPKRKLLEKINNRKAVHKRWGKREDRRARTHAATEARLVKKTIPPPDEQPSTSAEAVFDAPSGDEKVLLVPEAMPSTLFSTTTLNLIFLEHINPSPFSVYLFFQHHCHKRERVA